MHWRWDLTHDHCTGCGICVDVCAHGALVLPPEQRLPEPIAEACTGCMDCVEECPFDAISVRQREQ